MQTMTWGETWRAIKGGDTGVIAASLLELAIAAGTITLIWWVI